MTKDDPPRSAYVSEESVKSGVLSLASVAELEALYAELRSFSESAESVAAAASKLRSRAVKTPCSVSELEVASVDPVALSGTPVFIILGEDEYYRNLGATPEFDHVSAAVDEHGTGEVIQPKDVERTVFGNLELPIADVDGCPSGHDPVLNASQSVDGSVKNEVACISSTMDQLVPLTADPLTKPRAVAILTALEPGMLPETQQLSSAVMTDDIMLESTQPSREVTPILRKPRLHWNKQSLNKCRVALIDIGKLGKKFWCVGEKYKRSKARPGVYLRVDSREQGKALLDYEFARRNGASQFRVKFNDEIRLRYIRKHGSKKCADYHGEQMKDYPVWPRDMFKVKFRVEVDSDLECGDSSEESSQELPVRQTRASPTRLPRFRAGTPIPRRSLEGDGDALRLEASSARSSRPPTPPGTSRFDDERSERRFRGPSPQLMSSRPVTPADPVPSWSSACRRSESRSNIRPRHVAGQVSGGFQRHRFWRNKRRNSAAPWSRSTPTYSEVLSEERGRELPSVNGATSIPQPDVEATAPPQKTKTNALIDVLSKMEAMFPYNWNSRSVTSQQNDFQVASHHRPTVVAESASVSNLRRETPQNDMASGSGLIGSAMQVRRSSSPWPEDRARSDSHQNRDREPRSQIDVASGDRGSSRVSFPLRGM